MVTWFFHTLSFFTFFLLSPTYHHDYAHSLHAIRYISSHTDSRPFSFRHDRNLAILPKIQSRDSTRGEKRLNRSGSSVVHHYSHYHSCVTTQREGDVPCRYSARRRDRSHIFPQVSCDRGTECGRRRTGIWTRAAQFPLSSSAEITHVRHVIKRLYILASGPSTSSRSFYSTAPRLSLFLYYIIRNYIIYTPQIYTYIFISLILSKLVARSRRMERETIITNTNIDI